MGNSEQDSNSGIPAWQRSQSAAADPRSDPPVPEATATIDQARKFLEDEEVQKDTRERKVEFLKSKGIEEGVILELLDEEGKKAPPKVSGFLDCPQSLFRMVLTVAAKGC